MSNEQNDPAAEVLKAAAKWAVQALKLYLQKHPERAAALAGAPLQVRVSRIRESDPSVALAALVDGNEELLIAQALRRLDPSKLD